MASSKERPERVPKAAQEDSGVRRRPHPEGAGRLKRAREVLERIDEIEIQEKLGSIEGLPHAHLERIQSAEEKIAHEKKELLAELRQLRSAEHEAKQAREEARIEAGRKRAEQEAAERPEVEAKLEREFREKYERWKKLLVKLQAQILPAIEAEGKKILGLFPRKGPLPYKWFSFEYAGQEDVAMRKAFDSLTISLFPIEAWTFANRMNKMKKTIAGTSEDKSRMMYDDIRQAYADYLMDRPYPGLEKARLERTYVDSKREQNETRRHVGDSALDMEMRNPTYES